MIIYDMVYDEPLLICHERYPPLTLALSGHLLVSRGWPLNNGGSPVRTTQPFLVSSRNAAFRDDIKNGCVADYTHSHIKIFEYKVFLNQLILGRMYLQRTCNLRK